MRLARKKFHGHIDAMKIPIEADSAIEMWKVNDVKAFAIIATMLRPKLQSLICSATSTDETCENLKVS